MNMEQMYQSLCAQFPKEDVRVTIQRTHTCGDYFAVCIGSGVATCSDSIADGELAATVARAIASVETPEKKLARLRKQQVELATQIDALKAEAEDDAKVLAEDQATGN